VLVYPKVDEGIDAMLELDGHTVRVCTVDIGQEGAVT